MKKVLGLVAGVSLLAGCGNAGLGGDIESCRPEFQSSTPATDEDLALMFNSNREAAGMKIIDSTANQGMNYPDYVNVPGEAVCRLEDGSLVFTVAGLSLQEAMTKE